MGIRKRRGVGGERITVALAGNPNVGKSTLFNSLTGLHRHTGNWTGKTVDTASAAVRHGELELSLVDIPGTYSLISHSAEEEVARNYICFGGADITVVVCDATSLEHCLSLVLQIGEARSRCIVCVNLMDEAERRGIRIDTDELSRRLGVPVVPTVARERRSLRGLLDAVAELHFDTERAFSYRVSYPDEILHAASIVESALGGCDVGGVSHFWLALRLIEGDAELGREISERLGGGTPAHEVLAAAQRAREYLFSRGMSDESFRDLIVGAIISDAEELASAVVQNVTRGAASRDRRIDKILTGRVLAFPVMLLLLASVLLITLFLANIPSELLGRLFSFLECKLLLLFSWLEVPEVITDALVLGVFRILGSVVSVMLPPMAIFFPMFTLLEDSGYLPRVAYNLDRPFAACGACGKQSLTMCMGLGCNAVGVAGARIIDSRRERLLAILTNAFVPCNGRLPMLVSIVSVAFIIGMGTAPTPLVALAVFLFILLGILMTFPMTLLLSRTVLSGESSSFTIELPPYRRPQFLRVILHSLTTRVASVLLRAVAVAAPMGLFIFLLSNIYVGSSSLITHAASLLDPVGRSLGMDGVLLLSFILGIPANEIVIPIAVMIYTSGGVMPPDVGIGAVSALFSECGWSVGTAVSAALFSLFHFPCSTTLITAYKETGSIKYTALTFILPTAVGAFLCILSRLILSLLGV